ncbi:carboxymuconolactone decarboxylase family protein [Catellatospora coxensis]
MLRETLLADGLTTRLDREAVAAAVSAANSCPYCVDVHGGTLTGLGGRDAVDAAGPGGTRLRELTAWAGRPGAAAPFPPAQAPELIGTAVTFHYLNRMVNVFLPDSPLPAALGGTARQAVSRVAARLLGALARGRVAPGGSAGLLPGAALPADLAWARGRPSVAAAFGAAAAAVDEAGGSCPMRCASWCRRRRPGCPTAGRACTRRTGWTGRCPRWHPGIAAWHGWRC